MVKRFLKYVEIMTKITSVFAFLMTMAYLFYVHQAIDWRRTAVFFCSMFIFDLTTTAINNYIDAKSNGQELQFESKPALLIIIVLLGISTGLGLYLVYLTDAVVLLLGGLCFVFGIFYTFGPLPISRQPLGEFFSGLFYGLFIPFLVLYINMPEGTYLSLDLGFDTIGLRLQVMPLLTVLLLSVPPFCATANIMLANNICDLEKDIKVRRHTLPYYLGRYSLYLFAALYYLSYAAVILLVILRRLSPVCLLFTVTLWPVQKNIKTFFKTQDKATTFLLSIKNYLMIMGADTLLIFLSGLFTL